VRGGRKVKNMKGRKTPRKKGTRIQGRGEKVTTGGKGKWEYEKKLGRKKRR
jgi:hypothetical protein